MSDQQVKEFFSSVLEGGPADRLDLDRAVAAGRRRRRVRTATTLGSAAAVLVVVGALVVSVLPDDGRIDLGGATLSPAPTATASAAPAIIAGTDVDWALALEPFLPAGTETPAVYSSEGARQSFPSYANARAAFRLVRDGRATALVVTAYSMVPEQRSASEVVAARIAELEKSCDGTTITCDPRVETSSGPVIVRRWADGSHIAASSVRDTGIVVTVDSWNGDASEDRILEGSGTPGLADDIDALVSLAAAVPLPASVVTTPTPVPSTDAPTTAPSPSDAASTGPEPIPTGTAPTPEPTTSWTPKPAGLLGTVADTPCEQRFTLEYRVPAPITGDVIEYVLCPLVAGEQTLQAGTITIQQGNTAFRALDEALRLPELENTTGVCGANAIVVRPIFVRTAAGWFLVVLPTDGCHPRKAVLEAVSAAGQVG